MDNIEENFYETFGIKPKYNFESCERCIYFDNDYCKCDKDIKYTECDNAEPLYPQITDRILLELICILNKHYAENFQCATMLVGDTTEKIKECILKDCIEQSQHIKTEIQQLFKGGEQQ